MNHTNTKKITPRSWTWRFTLILILALIVGAFALFAQDTNQTVTPPATGVDATAIDLNLFTAMGSQFLKTPANLLLILAVSVLAWLWEITPALNSRYVPHFCVFAGAIGYPFLADRSAIPPAYPHPLVVMILSGIIVGALAAAVHKPLMRKLGVVPPVVALLLACMGLSGCANTPEAQLQQYTADARDLGEFGTRAALLENPKFIKELEDTLAGLRVLALQPEVITLDSLTRVLQRLPIAQLQSEKTQLYIMGGRILLRRASGPVELGGLGNLRPIVLALIEGMEAGKEGVRVSAATPPYHDGTMRRASGLTLTDWVLSDAERRLLPR